MDHCRADQEERPGDQDEFISRDDDQDDQDEDDHGDQVEDDGDDDASRQLQLSINKKFLEIDFAPSCPSRCWRHSWPAWTFHGRRILWITQV